MKQKEYTLRLYDKNFVFRRDVTNICNSTFSRTYKLGGGSSELRLSFLRIGENEIAFGDILKIQVYDEYNDGLIVFQGFVQEKNVTIKDSETLLEVIFLPIHSRLWNKNAPNSITGNIQDTVTALVASINLDYNYFSSGNVVVGDTKTSFFGILKIGEAIKQLAQGRSLYFSPIGTVNIFDVGTNHLLIYERDVVSFVYKTSQLNYVNKLNGQYKFHYITGFSGPDPILIESYDFVTKENTAEIALYGLFEENYDTKLYIGQYSTLNPPTPAVETAVQKKLDGFSGGFVKSLVSLFVKNTYNIESINPGDTITIKNAEIPVQNVLVYSITKNEDGAEILFEQEGDFSNAIEKITQRNFNSLV